MNRTRASGRTVGGLRTLSLQAPAVTLLLLWMIVPLGMTIWFSFQRYNLLMPEMTGFAGLENYEYLLTDPALWSAMGTTLLLVGWVLVITVVGGTLLAVLFQQDFAGRGIARVLAISPFFVMPTVSALVWKNMMMHPSRGVGVVSTVAGASCAGLVLIATADLHHHHRLVAVAAVCATDPADGDAIAG